MSQLATNSLSYKGKPIRQFSSLCKALGIMPKRLVYVRDAANSLYRNAKEVEKNDGTIRVTYDAEPLLKDIHRRIKRNILDRVSFPNYLTGSIKGQDYKTNAELHQNAKIVIAEDISGFFPSTTYDHVYDIWKNFFGFSQEVAECLTMLTTLNEALPQGAITSSHLANLVFWRDEPRLQSKLNTEGITYSRYVDDVVVSSQTVIPHERKKEIIAGIYGLMIGNGYKPKRNKHELKTSRERMSVTKLNVNAKPGIPKEQRAHIRAAVHHLEILASTSANDIAQSNEFRSVLGKINNLSRFHKGEAYALKKRLMCLCLPKPC